MTNERNCENCAHARPFGGENDNRCDAWECEYIDRKEAIKAYKERRDIVRCEECKASEKDEDISRQYGNDHLWCRVWSDEVMVNDFCSYGERRADNDKTRK